MAVSKVFSLLMSALLVGFALAQSPSGAPAPSPVANTPAPSKPPSHVSPSPSPAKSTTPPPRSSSPSPSPAAVFSPPSPPSDTTPSPSPSVAVPPSTGLAPVPSHNGAVLNRAGLAAAVVGFFAVVLVA